MPETPNPQGHQPAAIVSHGSQALDAGRAPIAPLPQAGPSRRQFLRAAVVASAGIAAASRAPRVIGAPRRDPTPVATLSAGGGTTSGDTTTVDWSFATGAPPGLMVHISHGGKVIWHNPDSVPHSVVLDSGTALTGLIPAGGSVSTTINLAVGSYPFHCGVHGFAMIGTLDVT